MDVLLVKLPGGMLAPLDDESADQLKKIKSHHVLECKLKRNRKPEFHRRFFKLLDIGFDAWTEVAPEVTYRGQAILPNRERFREDITILAGYYEATFNLRGEVRMKAKSISFASMDQDEFEGLYSAVIDVLLRNVLTQVGYTEQSLREHVDRVLSFDRG